MMMIFGLIFGDVLCEVYSAINAFLAAGLEEEPAVVFLDLIHLVRRTVCLPLERQASLGLFKALLLILSA